MRRRDFVAHLGGAVVAWPLPALAQTGPLPVVGVLRLNPANVAETFAEPLRHYMKQFGWQDGGNVRFFFAWATGAVIASRRWLMNWLRRKSMCLSALAIPKSALCNVQPRQFQLSG